jgi:biopolymer transport protein ExbD
MAPKPLFLAGIVTSVLGLLVPLAIRHWLLIEFKPDPFNDYEEVGILLIGLFNYMGAVGLACIAWAVAMWLRNSFWKAYVPKLFPELLPRNHFRLLRHRPMPLMTQLPNFGLFCGAILWIMMFIFMSTNEFPSKGLLIQLKTRYPMTSGKTPSQETLSVYLAADGKLYVNGKMSPRDALGAKLHEELSHRLEWTVYFEADRDALNMDAVYAMDTIQGLGAKLVWITPKVRKELQEAAQLSG